MPIPQATQSMKTDSLNTPTAQPINTPTTPAFNTQHPTPNTSTPTSNTSTPSPITSATAVVLGAGLTGLTTAFYLRRAGIDVVVVEQADRIGGMIESHREDGFVFESGPNTGVVSYPEVAELFDDLGDRCALETAHESAKRRLIWKGGAFHALPSGPVGGLRTPLFSLRDKFGILLEPWRKRGTDPNETVGALAARRLGRSFLDYAVDPFLSGVYAGDPMRLPTRLALPKLYNLEQTYGSFIRGAIAKHREPKTDRDRLATKAVFSAQGGLGRLVDALGEAIGHERIVTAASHIAVQPEAGGWAVTYADRDGQPRRIACRRVVTTCPAYALPILLPFVDRAQMAAISNLRYAPVVQVGVGLRNCGGLRHMAFGGLVPSRERQRVLGILFPSACFDGRAPEDGASFAYFMGGVRHPEYVYKTDDELAAIVDDTLHTMLGYPADVHADTMRIYRHERAIPQYELSSQQRFDTLDALARQYPTLTIGGNLRGGIGMADRIRQARAMADDIAAKEGAHHEA